MQKRETGDRAGKKIHPVFEPDKADNIPLRPAALLCRHLRNKGIVLEDIPEPV
jgi:hypothetical protein